jgi:hypothetical protein
MSLLRDFWANVIGTSRSAADSAANAASSAPVSAGGNDAGDTYAAPAGDSSQRRDFPDGYYSVHDFSRDKLAAMGYVFHRHQVPYEIWKHPDGYLVCLKVDFQSGNPDDTPPEKEPGEVDGESPDNKVPDDKPPQTQPQVIVDGSEDQKARDEFVAQAIARVDEIVNNTNQYRQLVADASSKVGTPDYADAWWQVVDTLQHEYDSSTFEPDPVVAELQKDNLPADERAQLEEQRQRLVNNAQDLGSIGESFQSLPCPGPRGAVDPGNGGDPGSGGDPDNSPQQPEQPSEPDNQQPDQPLQPDN